MNCSGCCCENEKNDESKNWQTTVTCLDYEQKKCALFSWHLSKSISPVILWCSCWRIKFTPLPDATWEKTSCQVKQSIQLLYKCLIYDKYPLEAHRGASAKSIPQYFKPFHFQSLRPADRNAKVMEMFHQLIIAFLYLSCKNR